MTSSQYSNDCTFEDVVEAPAEEMKLIITRHRDAADTIDEIELSPPPLRIPLPGLDYLHSYLERLLQADHRPAAVLAEVQRDLLAGRLRAVAIAPDGDRSEIARTAWAGADAEQTLRTARLGGAAVYVVADVPSAVEPVAAGKPTELSTTERNTVYRMLLGMAMDCYGYQPHGGRSDVVPTIARELDVRGLRVTDDTIRKYLNDAVEAVYDQAKDQTLSRRAKPNSVSREKPKT